MSKSLSIAILLAAILSSCKTIEQSISRENTSNSSHTLILKDSLQIGWKFGAQVPVNFLQELPPNTPIYISDTAENGQFRGQIRFLKDELGNLHAYCDERDQIIRQLRREITDRSTALTQDTQTVRQPWYRKYFLQILIATYFLGLLSPNILRRIWR